jgi:hypothetical protein
MAPQTQNIVGKLIFYAEQPEEYLDEIFIIIY